MPSSLVRIQFCSFEEDRDFSYKLCGFFLNCYVVRFPPVRDVRYYIDGMSIAWDGYAGREL